MMGKRTPEELCRDLQVVKDLLDLVETDEVEELRTSIDEACTFIELHSDKLRCCTMMEKGTTCRFKGEC